MDRGERFEQTYRSEGGQAPNLDSSPTRRRREQPEPPQATLLSLIEELEATIDRASRIPFSSKVLIDRDVYLDAVDAIRLATPEAVVQAERIVRDRERIMAQAEAESERVTSLAREQAAFLISDRQLLRSAELQSEAILNTARDEANEIISSAQKYAADLLTRLEGEIMRILNEIRKAASQAR